MSTLIRNILGALALGAVAAALIVYAPALRTASFWQGFAQPGQLSTAHRFLQGNCAGCHEATHGVEVARCIACHANQVALLQRQPTAFHSNINACVDCHHEHGGDRELRTAMNHQALAGIGLRLLANAPVGSEAHTLSSHLLLHGSTTANSVPNEQWLDCFGCHETRDRHLGQFGRECGVCHGTQQWTIAQFRHPSPSSTDCAQCHRPPPSHSMGHFEMVSKRVAGEEHAEVAQCYLCHQTTSWNDIRSVGMYFHH